MTSTSQSKLRKRKRKEKASSLRLRKRFVCYLLHSNEYSDTFFFLKHLTFSFIFASNLISYILTLILQDKNVLPQDKKDDQKAVDAELLKAIEAVPDLKAYLGARFSLKDGMKPHELVF